MFGAAVMVVLGIIACRFAAPVLIILFFLVFFIVLYMVRRHRLSYFYLIFPFLIAAGYTVTLNALCDSGFVSGLREKEKFACEISGKVRKVEPSQSGYRLTLGNVKLCPGGEKVEDCIVYCGEAFARGTVVTVRGDAALFDAARNPGEFDAAQYYRAFRIGFKLYADVIEVKKENNNPVYALADRLLKRLHGSLYSVADPKNASVFAAILLGERDGLDAELSELFNVCGIGHILAISGLHISLIGMGLYRILRKVRAGCIPSALAGTAVIIFYGVMTGGGTSTVRAIIMYITAVYADVAERTYDILSAASLAAVIILAKNPLLLYNGGFQLSFGAVLGIVLLAGTLKNTFNIRKKIPSAFVTAFCVWAAGLPVIMWNYYEIPVLSVFINMLVVPLMSVVMVSGICGGIAGIFCRLAGEFCIGPGVAVLNFYRLVCEFNLKIPWAVWVCGRPAPWQPAVYYAILCFVIILLRKKNIRHYIIGLLPAFAIIMLRFNNCFETCFLDVGQGDGIFIRSGSGGCFLVDGGSSDKSRLYDYTLEPFLMSKGVSKIDCAIVTHCDADHISGLEGILEKGKIKIDTLYMPENCFDDDAGIKLAALAKQAGTAVKTVYCGCRFTAGETVITCVYPELHKDDGYVDRNGASAVLAVQNGDFSMLLTGDIGEKQEKSLCNAVSEYAPFYLLKAAHHGSAYSNSAAFLSAVSPENVVISCGRNNRYGHPHEETLERLRTAGANVYRTDSCGAVTVRVKNQKIIIFGFN